MSTVHFASTHANGCRPPGVMVSNRCIWIRMGFTNCPLPFIVATPCLLWFRATLLITDWRTTRSRKHSQSQRLWSRELYISYPVHAGDILLLRHGVIHAGVQNKLRHDRNVLFLLYTDSGAATTDSYQLYPWSWLGGLSEVGESHPLFFASLVENGRFQPLAHYENAQQRKRIQTALKKYVNQVATSAASSLTA